MKPTILHPPVVHSTQGVGYSHVALAQGLAFVAGQVALDREGKLVGPGDIDAQATQVYANLRAVLEHVGSSMEHIVKLTTYLTRREDLPGMRLVRNRTFSAPFPPNTLLFISGLASPDYLIEVEAIATLKA